MGVQRLVILDKNFLQAEGRATPRLCALVRCGVEFILTDTLIYELCSDDRPALWPSLQKKLFPFADRIHVWFHTSELLRQEIATNQPIAGPKNEPITQALRDWFQSEQIYVPPNLKMSVAEAHQQREIDSMANVAPMARAFAEILNLSKGDLANYVRNNIMDDQHIRWIIHACYGDPESKENYIPDAENRVNASWFAFHNARVTMALIGIFLKKYGLSEEPGRKFPNTKLDTDYLALLPYADSLASDETGDMAEMCEWLYGSSKKRISSDNLFKSIPTENDIRLDAYWRWDGRGRTHGRDVEDWLEAEADLCEEMWKKL